MWMLYDSNKMLVGVGDAFSERVNILPKNDSTLSLNSFVHFSTSHYFILLVYSTTLNWRRENIS